MVADPRDRQYGENWPTMEKVLAARSGSVTCAELITFWPEDSPPPNLASVYRWLHTARDRKLVKRSGDGTRTDPYRFRLRTKQDDETDNLTAHLDPIPPMRGLND